MRTIFNDRLTWFTNSIRFFKEHLGVILLLGLIAALGRALQLGALGPVKPLTNVVLEVMVQSARVVIFLYALGLTKLKSGILKVIRIFTSNDNRKQNWRIAISNLKNNRVSVLLNIMAFILFAILINLLIDYTAYQTCLYYKLKAERIIADTASVWVLLLFLKNLSVIPFTLIFNAIFLLWITNRLKFSGKMHQSG